MPFGRRKSNADTLENEAITGPSFRVLERTEVAPGKSFEAGARYAAGKPHSISSSKPIVSDLRVDDNLFADFKTNRGSGSSNTTKTISTDTSSRHSNVSTAPSSADLSHQQDEFKNTTARKPLGDGVSKSPSGFLNRAGRTFSFGQKKHLANTSVSVADEPLPPLPRPPVFQRSEDSYSGNRSRATTSSTSKTVTPPKLEEDFNLDLGRDFSKMFALDKRASVMTVRGSGTEPSGRQPLGPRSLTGNRLMQPAPIEIDNAAKIDAAPYSYDSHHSNDGLLTSSPVGTSPGNENGPLAVNRQPSPVSGPSLGTTNPPGTRKLSGFFGRRSPATTLEEAEDEESKLLKDSLSAVNKFMTGSEPPAPVPKPAPTTRYRRNEDTFGGSSSEYRSNHVKTPEYQADDDNLFENSLAQSSHVANRFVTQKPSPPRNKVMTPAQFEKYRRDKERNAPADSSEEKSDDEEEIDYDDEEDEVEKARQQAKQRRKQEAHMAVYRQQMMKVTGEANGSAPARPSVQTSLSTPNLPMLGEHGKTSDSEEDEEVPLAILAAHGFPNKARPPARLSSMMSNPNLRAAAQPSYQRPGSVAGDAPTAGASGGGRLPAFARNLPKDPFLGAGLVHNPVRESFALGGGGPAPAGNVPGTMPPGGLVGVIANEERSRAMRRGSPAVGGHQLTPADAINGIPPHMMYANRPVSTMMGPGDPAQMQMNVQMQQFMQMQMQFMQLMAGQQGGNPGMRPMSHMPPPPGSVMGMPTDMGGGMLQPGMGGQDMRHSFVGNVGNGSVVDFPRGDLHNRSMSMVQPSSSSWFQPPPANPGFVPSTAPSIHIQGVGYAPSIAPSERSNVGLPGRYRPVSHMPAATAAPADQMPRTSTMSGALAGFDKQQPKVITTTIKKIGGNASDDDEEEGWAAMKEKREKKRSLWKNKKSFGADIGALIS